MGLPLYKVLEIYDPKKPAIWAKLANASIGSQPVVLDISKLGADELKAIELVEEFMETGKARAFPYPLYIVSNLSDYQGSLEVVPSTENLPLYYKRKNRPMNMKENNLMAKVSLKQKKLENLNLAELDPVLEKYGANHKMIFKKQGYLEYLSNILDSLRGKQ